MAKLSYISKLIDYLTKRGLIVPSLLICINTVAQPNLIPNGSFESYVTCPVSSNDYEGFVSDWYNPTDSIPYIPTPDYYNSCANPSNVGVPQNFCGFLNAKNGSAYAGIFFYNPAGFTDCDSREYLTVKLASPLIKDSIYNYKMSVSFALRYNSVALSNIGVVLSKDSIHQYLACVIDLPDSSIILKNHQDSIVYNPGSWKELNFTFKANGGEAFLCIGNFDTDNDIDSIHYNSPQGYFENTYYLIDDVSLVRATSVGVDENEMGNKIKVFPNPAQDLVTIKLPPSYNQAILDIYNLTGQLIAQKLITTSQLIPISELGNGVYIFVFQNEDKVIGRHRVVVAR
ncbi:MAG: T9SS type A sorting domain-containing protein [Sphingobacteriales bacterium JAD_PAG50586_3]|nr:MAG: T9SS type A sorting domain-containing protein [Sphingobacteriales bacterium JAD_PAG50586_3]